MPTKPPTYCPPGRTFGNEAARKLAFNRTRPSPTAQGYDADWRALRKRFLERNPTCCEPGCSQPATEADHIHSVRDRPDLRLAEVNLRPYCKAHHSRRTALEQGFARPGGAGQ